MRRRTFLQVTALLPVAGCGLAVRPYPERREWPLQVRQPGAFASQTRAGGGKTLLVRSVRAAAGLDIRGLQSLRPDGSLYVDYYEEWAVPPSESVESDLRQWLADGGLFAAVVAPGSRATADLVLEGVLTSFRADPAAGTARATLAIVLIDQRPNPAKILLQRSFSAEARLSSAGGAAIAHALQAALGAILPQVEQAIAPYA